MISILVIKIVQKIRLERKMKSISNNPEMINPTTRKTFISSIRIRKSKGKLEISKKPMIVLTA